VPVIPVIVPLKGRADASQEQTDAESFDVPEPETVFVII
jgi:catalase (peroxidase I)